MATEKTVNYTTAQETVICEFVGTGTDGKLSFADCETIAARDDMKDADGNPRKARSIAAKISRMGLPYEKKAAVRKDGSKVESKADIVRQIAEMTNASFEALDKAARPDLVKLRDYLAA